MSVRLPSLQPARHHAAQGVAASVAVDVEESFNSATRFGALISCLEQGTEISIAACVRKGAHPGMHRSRRTLE